jgi:hypothetical protein|tara:strand:- start:39961 stop:40158 length:198 start_codon:yes stop_codon:yes gene_type:complete
MKIKIEDYYGNDICSFKVNTFASNNSLQDIGEFEGCSYADMDIDEYSEPYIRIQLENENLTLLQN